MIPNDVSNWYFLIMNKNKYNEFNQRLYYKSDFLQESPHTKTGVRCDHITNYDAQWDDELPEISPSLDCHSTQSSEARQQTVDSLLELRVTHNDLPAWTGDARHVLGYYIIPTEYRLRHAYRMQHMHAE